MLHNVKIETPEARLAAIGDMTVVFVGTANWDIYKDNHDRLWAIPKPECLGCYTSGYGDKHRIRTLMSKGYFSYTPTAAGLELMQGLCSRLMTDARGNPWHRLAFH